MRTAVVRNHRGNHNRLGFALQLLTLRYLGFCPDDLATAPVTVVAYVAEQLDVTPDVLDTYGDRAQTRTDHFLELQAYLGFRQARLGDLRSLAKWLLERAPEGSLAYCSVLSVIETCRLRQVNPWAYIANVIAQGRKGISPPPIPVALQATP